MSVQLGRDGAQWVYVLCSRIRVTLCKCPTALRPVYAGLLQFLHRNFIVQIRIIDHLIDITITSQVKTVNISTLLYFLLYLKFCLIN